MVDKELNGNDNLNSEANISENNEEHGMKMVETRSMFLEEEGCKNSLYLNNKGIQSEKQSITSKK